MEEHHELRIVNSFGVGTARYCSCWPSSLSHRPKKLDRHHHQDHHQGDDLPTEVAAARLYVDVPLGCNIVRWDVDRQERVKFFRPHGDIVTCMLKVEDFTFTASEAGEVAIWDQDWNVIDRSHHSRKVKITHAAVSPCRQRVITTSEHAGGLITIFSVYRDHATSGDGRLRLVKSMELGEGAHYTFAEWVDKKGGALLVAVQQPPRSSRHSRETSAETSVVSQAALHLIQVDDRAGQWRVVKERALEATSPYNVSVSAVAKEEEDEDDDDDDDDEEEEEEGEEKEGGSGEGPRMAIALSGRRVEVVDMRTLAPLWRIDASGGSGLIKCLAFKSGGRLLCPGDDARLTVWHRDRLEGEFSLHGAPRVDRK
jgi:hypothetical protein